MMKKVLLLLSVALIFVACADDDSFSTSKSNRLSFMKDGVEIDTLTLDTVFAHIGSSTYTFWVHNQSSDGIRLTNVMLRGGNQYGFRVNVDGTELGKSSGYQMNDLEIRKGDSVRVFVEVLSPSQKGIPARTLDDAIVFNLESGISQSLALHTVSMDAEEMRGKVITEDVTFTSQRPIIIYDSLVVGPNATLTIDAGTTLYFHDGAGIDVHGRLDVKGTYQQKVTFRGDRLDHMFSYLPYDNVSGQWKGIHFYETSYDNSLICADIHGACDGIVCDSSDVSRGKLYMHSCVVHNCKGQCVMLKHCSVGIYNCQFTNALHNCLEVCGGNVVMNGCTIAQFYVINNAGDYAFKFTNTDGTHHYPLENLQVVNSIITGMKNDEILGNGDTLSAYNYCFDHCLIKTPEVQNPQLTAITFEKDSAEWSSAKNFVLIDADNLRYDFRLDSLSLAIGKADPKTALETDITGIPRSKDEPDQGCYERNKGGVRGARHR